MKLQKEPYYCSQNINKLTPNINIPKWNDFIAYYLITHIQKFVSLYDNQQGGYKLDTIRNHIINIPLKNKIINSELIDTFMEKIEQSQLLKVKNYLVENGLDHIELTVTEKTALDTLTEKTWCLFNLRSLFGNATRGKRLKSEDRILGTIPFVTAGEVEQGVSAFISNNITIFKKNTITIDMFGSAKYRNHNYGCDDHVAVVHTEGLEKYATIFLTTAIHKSSYNGQFNYGRNFYAKDADDLNILLPTKNNEPDYVFMQNYISAIHKLMVKKVIFYLDQKQYF